LKALAKNTAIKLSVLSPDGNTQHHSLYAYITAVSASSTTVKHGDKAKLTCSVSGAVAAPTKVTFEDGSTEFAGVSKTGLVNGVLTATVTTTNTVTADKTYTCEFEIAEVKYTGSPKIDVIKLEATTVTPVPVGSPYTFTCKYSESQEKHEVVWTGATGKITTTAQTAATGTSTLSVDKVNSDTAVVCSIGEANSKLVLDVYDVTVKLDPTTKRDAGDTVSITCEISGLTTSTGTTWKWLSADNKEITSGVTSTKENSKLIMSKLKNAQKLKCQATKNAKTITKDIDIKIRCM
jgi:hypothetical protein